MKELNHIVEELIYYAIHPEELIVDKTKTKENK